MKLMKMEKVLNLGNTYAKNNGKIIIPKKSENLPVNQL